MNEDIYSEEPKLTADEESHARALLNEQLMANMCSPENRSI